MALHCHVHMEEQGLVGEDDGSAAWHKTAISLLVAGRVVKGNLLHEWYSGHKTLRVVDDALGLDRLIAKALLLEVYNVSSVNMRACSCDMGEAFFDLEGLIRDLFYRSTAERVIRQIRSDA